MTTTTINTSTTSTNSKTNRAVALAAGEKTFQGAPCCYGHDGVRYTIGGVCVTCQKMKNDGLAPPNGWRARRSPFEPVTLDFIRANCIETDTGCLEWQKYRNADGYGQLWYRDKRDGAHVASFELSGGETQPGGVVMHSCDNPPCCNPAHLSAGTRLDNSLDRDRKGRNRNHRGQEHGMSVLTEDQVAEIKAQLIAGKSTAAIAAEYGVGQTTIYNIRTGRTWKHVQPAASLAAA